MTPHRPLHAQLIWSLLATLTALWMLMLGIIWLDTQHQINQLLDEHLVQSASLLVAQQGPHVRDDKDESDERVPHPKVTSVMFQVFHDGVLTLRSDNAPVQPLVHHGQGFRIGFEDIQVEDQLWRVYAAFGQETDVHVYVAERAATRSAILYALLRGAFWPLLLALPLLGLSIWWTIGNGLRPLRELSAALTARESMDFRKFTLDSASGEMLTLVDSLNALMGRIEALVYAERRFTADAAHELRTPIAAIRTQAQVALGATDEPSRAQALRGTIAGCDRANRVVTQLLLLARLENATPPSRTRVDLAAVCRDTAAELAPQAFNKQQVLELDCDPLCQVLGDETLLSVMLRNLIDNAIRYSPVGARVSLRLQKTNHQVVVSVDDSGPGLPTEDIRRLGERFFRAGHPEASGSGLGWSIVRRIAAVHDSRLVVAPSQKEAGLHVSATFAAA